MEVGEVSVCTQLSKPLALSTDFDDSLRIAYDYFEANINNRAKRPALFEKEVFIEAKEQIEGRPVGFWHIVSLEDNHVFKVLPCNNDITMECCDENCNTKKCTVTINFGADNRNLCLYRASRIPWIVDIIKFANRGDPSVKTWLKSNGGKQSKKLYLRYNHFGNDYVLIFSVEKRYYRLISAFPVFYTKEKKEFDKDYDEYKWSYF